MLEEDGHTGARRRRWPLVLARFVLSLLFLALLVVVGLWFARTPIATSALDRELAQRGVQARYRITKLGLSTERLEDVVIGDPRRPDLTAEWAEVLVTTRWSWTWPIRPGVTIRKITARGVRLNGRLVEGKLRLGQIDHLLPPPTGKPFAFPDFEVDLDRTTIRLDTPAGVVGMALRGGGKLSNGFRGQLAASAPRFAVGAGCVATSVRARVSLLIERRSPHVTGPLSASRVSCGRSRVELTQPNIVVDARLPERLDRWRGDARLGIAGMSVARGTLAGVTGAVRFDGNADATLGTLDILARRARFAEHAGRRLRFDGRYRASPRAGRAWLLGDVALDDLALGPALRAPLSRPLRAAAGTPVAPLGRAAAAALDRATRTMDVAGELKLVHGPRGGGARMETLRAASAGGARLGIAGGEGLTYYWPDAKLRIDGEAAMSGGGLPTARLSFDQSRPGGPIDGVLRVAPYAAGGSRLALAPVRFTSLAGGRTRIQTVVTLDGAFRSGRVAGLVVPLDGQVRGGDFAFNDGCTTARWASLRYQGLSLGATVLPLCPTGGALVRSSANGIAGGASLANPRFAGRFNGRPFTAAASRAVVALDTTRVTAENLRVIWGAIAATAAQFEAPLRARRFAASGVGFRVGEAPSQTRIDVEALNGGWAGSDFSGTFGQGRGQVGRVPLLMSGAAGDWSYRRNVLAVSGGLSVADTAENARFYPLRADAARFRLADNRIDAAAVLRHPQTRSLVGNFTIAHDLRSSAGNAILDVPGIAFSDAFQPEALTRLTTGVVALVKGSVQGRGDIGWDPAGVTSAGTFSTKDMNLAAAFGPVEGLTTTVRFSDLLALQTEPGQIAEIAAIRAGIAVFDGKVTYQLLPGQRVRVEAGRWPYAGGILSLDETILDFSRPTTKRLVFRVENLDAARFIQQMEFSNITATGRFSGVIPMEFDTAGGRIVGGRLVASAAGGTLSYIGELTDKALGTYGKLAFDALKSLRYNKFEIGLDGKLDGEFVADIELDGIALNTTRPGGLVGRALGQLAKIPFEFNIKISGPFRTLMATARSLEDPSLLIQSVLPEVLKDLPADTVVQPTTVSPPVQPKESEPVQ